MSFYSLRFCWPAPELIIKKTSGSDLRYRYHACADTWRHHELTWLGIRCRETFRRRCAGTDKVDIGGSRVWRRDICLWMKPSGTFFYIWLSTSAPCWTRPLRVSVWTSPLLVLGWYSRRFFQSLLLFFVFVTFAFKPANKYLANRRHEW